MASILTSLLSVHCQWMSIKRLSTLSMALLILIASTNSLAAGAAEYVQDAQTYIEKKDYKSAIIQLKNALKEDANNAEARFLLGSGYLNLGDVARAEIEFLKATKLSFKDQGQYQQLWVQLAQALLLQNKNQALLDTVKDDEKFTASVRSDILALRAQANLMLRQYQKAEPLFVESSKLNPKSVKGTVGQVRLALLNNNIEKAKQLISEAKKIAPDNADVWTIDGEIARISRNFKQAKNSFNSALKINENHLGALVGRAQAHVGLDEMDAALSSATKALKLAPKHTLANYLVALVNFRKGDADGALKRLDKVMQTNPKHLPSQQLSGAIHYSKGQLEQAAYALELVVASQPDNLGAVKLLAATYIKSKSPAKAIKIISTLYQSHKEDAQLNALLGNAYVQNREASRGMDYLEIASQLKPEAAGIRTQLAMAQLASGKSDEAIQQLESAVDLGPELMQADVLLILTHLRQGNFDKALDQANDLQKKAKDNPVSYNLKGAAYLGVKDESAARREFKKAIEIDKHFIPAMINLARLDEKQGNVDRAVESYENILKVEKGHLGSLMSLARITEIRGDTAKAVEYVERAKELNPDNVTPGLFLVRYYLRNNKPQKGLTVANELNTNHVNNTQVMKALGMTQFAAGKHDIAIQTFNDLAKLTPKEPEPYYLLAKAHLQLEKFKQAKNYIDKALALNSKHVPSLISMAELELRSGNIGKALAIAKDLQKNMQNSAVGYELEGDIHTQNKEFQQAASAYKAGFDKLARANLLTKWFQVEKAAGKSSSVYGVLENWIEKYPKNTDVALMYANDLQTNGENKKAIKYYERVLAVHPDHVLALNNVAWLYHLGKNPKSNEYAARAYKLVPNNPSVADTYGWLLVEQGKVDKGMVILKQAALQAPHLLEIRYHLAVAMHRSGKTSEATKELERLLADGKDFPESEKAVALLNQLKTGK